MKLIELNLFIFFGVCLLASCDKSDVNEQGARRTKHQSGEASNLSLRSKQYQSFDRLSRTQLNDSYRDLEQLRKEDFGQYLSELNRFKDSRVKDNSIRRDLNHIDAEHLVDLYHHLNETQKGNDRDLLRITVNELATRNPEGLLQIITETKGEVKREALLRLFAASAGLDYLLEHEEGFRKTLTDEDVKFLGVAAEAAFASMTYSEQKILAKTGNIPAYLRQSWLRSYAKSAALAGKSLESVLEAQAPADHASIVKTWALYTSTKDASKAITRIQQYDASGSILSSMAPQLANNYAKQDVNAALKWVMGLDQSEQKNTALYFVFKTWVEKDAEASGDWIIEMREGKARDIGAREIARYYINNNEFDKAALWSKYIADTSIRRQVDTDIQFKKARRSQ